MPGRCDDGSCCHASRLRARKHEPCGECRVCGYRYGVMRCGLMYAHWLYSGKQRLYCKGSELPPKTEEKPDAD